MIDSQVDSYPLYVITVLLYVLCSLISYCSHYLCAGQSVDIREDMCGVEEVVQPDEPMETRETGEAVSPPAPTLPPPRADNTTAALTGGNLCSRSCQLAV